MKNTIDFFKIKNGELGAVNFNNMIPVDEASLKEAEATVADKVILDNGYGTGECFDWSVLKSFKRSFILAGGLNPENLKEAIETYRPECLDISSGVETEKIKDKEKILTAVSIARE